MKVKVENLKDSQKHIKIEVEPERVNSVLDKVYSGIQKKANIPGYRQGKAPRDLIENHYDKTANDETLNRLIWDAYREAVIQQNLDPVGYPAVDDVNFSKGNPLTFAVKVDVRPEFKLKGYKGIRVKKKSVDLTEEDMKKGLEQLQESMAQYNNIDPRPIAKGDYVVCDYECFSDGKLIDKNENLWLYISEQLQPKELLEALSGAEVNVIKEVEVTYPKDYQYKELAGKKRSYKVTPKQIKQKILPEINDDLAKDTGQFKDLEELKVKLRENITTTKKLESERDIENQIFSFLLKSHSFEIPVSMVERQVAQLAEEAKRKLLHQGYKKEDLDKEGARLKEGLKNKAEDNVRLFFIIERIAKQEGIEVADKELDERVEKIATGTKEDAVEVRKRLEEKGLIDSLKEQIIHDKIVELLVREAKKGESK
ncbi:MAG: trigger factor [Candidatus Omnitrophica bacterium]|nr:trigger factor [Candidatus Omnitrophota bacterium]